MPDPHAQPAKPNFFDLLPEEIDQALTAAGWPRFRGKQVRQWVYEKQTVDPARMTNLSLADRQRLADVFSFDTGSILTRQDSNDGTIKLLITWPDGSNAETVMIPDGPRRTACVSSQVGCPVGCKFCASGIEGAKGNLRAGQIVQQVWLLNAVMGGMERESAERRLAERRRDEETERRSDSDAGAVAPVSATSSLRLSVSPSHPKVTNIVFMGMGEPMSNYAAVMKAVRILHHPECLNLGARRITISTVGVPAKIRQLASEQLPLNLALSLHAPSEPLRRELIPWAEHFGLGEILDACRFYFDQTGREITLEYILLSGVNDQPEHARELARLCRTIRANVNLIRYNEVAALPFKRPQAHAVVEFQEILRRAGVNAHVRKSRGRDIDAACGQLRRKEARQRLVQLGAREAGDD